MDCKYHSLVVVTPLARLTPLTAEPKSGSSRKRTVARLRFCCQRNIEKTDRKAGRPPSACHPTDFPLGLHHRTHPLCRRDAERGTISVGGTRNQCMRGSTERTPGEAPTMGEMSSRTAQHDFAKRFERGKLTFTGDVLQVISVSGRHQKFGKLLKRLTVGA